MNIEIATAIVNWKDHEEKQFFEQVTKEKIIEQTRWNTYFSMVYRDVRDNTFWEISWSRGSTEYQDQGPEDIEVFEVVPKEIKTIKYERKPAIGFMKKVSSNEKN